MEQTIVKLQTKLMREYYKYFSKYARGKKPDTKVAWVTSFTPIEILEALGISYYYPESYAAVIAASEKEQDLLKESTNQNLSRDCCSYSCCIEGCIQLEEGPRGVPPKPDILIATNNQCNTLPNWWNILSERYKIPLIVIDYPGEEVNREIAEGYVLTQHKKLIEKLEGFSGNKMDYSVLDQLIENSIGSVSAWKKVIAYMRTKCLKPTIFFDDISYLITSRCKPETARFYELMALDLSSLDDAENNLPPVFWLGYPLWYHQDRYLSELLDDFKIVGSNYLTWWNLDYSGKDCYEKLFNAYNYTFLNLSQETRTRRLTENIRNSGAVCAVTLHNKSCKCDFVSARNIDIPQAELEIDMIDRNFLDIEKAKRQISFLKDAVWEA